MLLLSIVSERREIKKDMQLRGGKYILVQRNHMGTHSLMSMET